MPRFRKSKRPADISVSTPTPPAELVQVHTPQRNLTSALTASSTAADLSIATSSYGTRDTSNTGTIVRRRDTGWQTAYGAARMAVEFAKESSDMFLPLKAVVGAMSVLIKNYDVRVYCW